MQKYIYLYKGLGERLWKGRKKKKKLVQDLLEKQVNP